MQEAPQYEVQPTAHESSQDPEHDLKQDDLHSFLQSASSSSFPHERKDIEPNTQNERKGNVLRLSCLKNPLLVKIISLLFVVIFEFYI